MIFLADACALIVFHGYGGAVFVSAIAVWEVTRKIALGKLTRPTPPDSTGMANGRGGQRVA